MRGAARVLEHNLMTYRRVWRGTLLGSFLGPVLFLGSMGLGLGSLVNAGPDRGIGGVPYLTFLAPGLLVTTAMQTATIETTYPILARVHWNRVYEAMLSTPLVVGDLLLGELAYLALRLTIGSALFFLVMAGFGAVLSPKGALAVPAAVLTGLAFGTPVLAFAVTQRHDSVFSLIFRLCVIPLFLFGGAFFPVDRLPAILGAAVLVTPIFHGIALARSLTLGGAELAASAGHVAYLLLWIVGGAAVARHTMSGRLRR